MVGMRLERLLDWEYGPRLIDESLRSEGAKRRRKGLMVGRQVQMMATSISTVLNDEREKW